MFSHAIKQHGITFHFNADDMQYVICIYRWIVAPLTVCLEEILASLHDHFLQLTRAITEAIVVGTLHQIPSSSMSSITSQYPYFLISHQWGCETEPTSNFLNVSSSISVKSLSIIFEILPKFIPLLLYPLLKYWSTTLTPSDWTSSRSLQSTN